MHITNTVMGVLVQGTAPREGSLAHFVWFSKNIHHRVMNQCVYLVEFNLDMSEYISLLIAISEM